jgi:hypothetical protein
MGNAGAKLKSSTIPTINFVFKSEIILSLLAINRTTPQENEQNLNTNKENNVFVCGVGGSNP